MTPLEQDLRRLFAAQAHDAPSDEELLMRVQVGSRRAARRRLALGSGGTAVAVAACVAAVSVGVLPSLPWQAPGAGPSFAAAVALPAPPIDDLVLPVISRFDGGYFVWGGTGEVRAGSSDGPEADALDPARALVLDTTRSAWHEAAAGPLAARVGAAAGWTGTEVVLAGGSGTLNRTALRADAAAYSPRTDAWRALPPLPEPRTDAALHVVDGSVFVVGGSTGRGSHDADLLRLADGGWERTTADHRVWASHPVGLAGIALFGFDDSQQPVVSVYDALTGGQAKTPALPQTQNPSRYALGVDGERLLVGLSDGEQSVVYSLGVGERAWVAELSVPAPRILGGNVFAPQSTQALRSDEGRFVSVGPHGVAVLQRHGAVSESDVSPRCADATSVGIGESSALLWIDGSCSNGASQRLVTFGGGSP